MANLPARYLAGVFYQIPDHLVDGLVRYQTEHIRTGGFLEAVIANDLARAASQAGYGVTLADLKMLVSWVGAELPSHAHGSYEAIDTWCAEPAERREQAG